MVGVSVIIPTYNRGSLLEEALESALCQTYKSYEIIVADDGSTDDTLPRLERFGDRIQILTLAHSGRPAVARNAAIASARGEYLAFLDSDDRWAPTKLQSQISVLERDSALVMCYTDAEFFDEKGRVLGKQSENLRLRKGRVFKHLLLVNFVPFSSVVARKSAVLEVGGFEQWLTRSEDWNLWLKLSTRGEIGLIPASLCQIRYHSSTLTADKMALFSDAIRMLDDIERRFPREFAASGMFARRSRAKMLSMLGRNYLFSGDTGQAKRLFWNALSNFPLRLEIIPFLLLALLGRRVVLTLRSLKKTIF